MRLTRRGFFGALAAFVAAPLASLTPVRRPYSASAQAVRWRLEHDARMREMSRGNTMADLEELAEVIRDDAQVPERYVMPESTYLALGGDPAAIERG